MPGPCFTLTLDPPLLCSVPLGHTLHNVPPQLSCSLASSWIRPQEHQRRMGRWEENRAGVMSPQLAPCCAVVLTEAVLLWRDIPWRAPPTLPALAAPSLPPGPALVTAPTVTCLQVLPCPLPTPFVRPSPSRSPGAQSCVSFPGLATTASE